MKDVFFLTRQILGYRLTRNKEASEEAVLVQQFLSFGSIFVVADPNTGAADWKSKQFGICTQDKCLRLYIEKEDAEWYAKDVGSVLPDKTPMVMQISAKMAQELIADYAQKAFIDKVLLCGKSPISAPVQLSHFTREVTRESPSTIMTEPAPPVPVVVVPQSGLKLVEEVKQALDSSLAADRRKIDPGQVFENLHSLISKLLQVNGIDMAELDKQLGLQDGFTKQFCSNLLNDNTPKKIVMDYLRYFGLLEYLNLFKGQCSELSQELKSSSKIDTLEIKGANVRTTERFKLISLRRGKDYNGAYVYQLLFRSDAREITTISSSHFNMVVGKDYELDGVSPLDEGTVSKVSVKNAAEARPSAIPTAEEEAAALEALERKSQEKKTGIPSQRQVPDGSAKDARSAGRNRYIAETPEEKMQREQNEIIGYIIKTEGCNSQDAKRKLEPLEGHPEAIASFAKYLKDGKPGPYAVRGYTPKKLMHELHYSPYEAYCMLAELEAKPKETLQRLKYRATDPQYQKPTPQKKQSE